MRNGFGTFPLSTDGVPEPDRINFLRDGLGRLMRLDVEAVRGMPFYADLTLRLMPGLGIISGRHGPFRMGRSPALIADGNDDLVLLVRTGTGILSRDGREIPIAPGSSILLSNADVGSYVFSAPASILALVLPRAPLKPLLGDVASRRHPLPRNDASFLLENYLSVMTGDQVPASLDHDEFGSLRSKLMKVVDSNILARDSCEKPVSTFSHPALELGRAMVAHIHDLVALAVGPKLDGAGEAAQRGLPAARLYSIKADIADCLYRGCDISVGKLAARQRITPRYVQMLFEGEGTTLTQFVLGQRLARAYRMLTNPDRPDRAIAAVAYDAGFSDLSYFIRSFRRAYGARPSEVRCRAAEPR